MCAEIGGGVEDPVPGDVGEGEHERGAGLHNDGERDQEADRRGRGGRRASGRRGRGGRGGRPENRSRPLEARPAAQFRVWVLSAVRTHHSITVC